MSDDEGFLKLDQTVDSIIVGVRHRKDLGDLGPLIHSIRDRGLLQPITITPDGVLVCGLRRLEAVKRLGWRTVNVWVRRVSEGAHRMLAEQDENAVRKPFTDLEAAELYREIKAELQAEAERNMRRTQWPARETDNEGILGFPDSGRPATSGSHPVGDSSKQAARLVTGTASHQRMEQILAIRKAAEDPAQPQRIRAVAGAALLRIRDGHPVNPLFTEVQRALGNEVVDDRPGRPTDEQLNAMAEAALEAIKADLKKSRKPKPTPQPTPTADFSLRMWLITFRDMDGWLDGYDVEEFATEVTEEQWATFKRVVDQMRRFEQAGDAVRAAARGQAMAG